MLNHIVIIGRLTRDVELRQTGSGISVANFSVAVERDFKNDKGEREADFIDVVAWRGSADFAAKYFHKGSLAAISGRLQIRGWTDKDGNKRKTAEIVAESIYFAESKRSDDSATRSTEPADFTPLPDTDDSDLPFDWLA